MFTLPFVAIIIFIIFSHIESDWRRLWITGAIANVVVAFLVTISFAMPRTKETTDSPALAARSQRAESDGIIHYMFTYVGKQDND